jgi:hypothetical protein
MTEETIVIDDVSYKWYSYVSPLDFLNAGDINNAQSNLQTLRSIMGKKGYNLNVLTNVSAGITTELIEVVEILNGIEYNLDILNDTDFKSAYYS